MAKGLKQELFVAARSSITRMSVDQKQVLVQRNAEDERHHLHSALVRESELLSSDVDNNVDVPAPPSSENQQTEKDLTDDKPASADKNHKPGVMPEPGTCCSSTVFMTCTMTGTLVDCRIIIMAFVVIIISVRHTAVQTTRLLQRWWTNYAQYM